MYVLIYLKLIIKYTYTSNVLNFMFTLFTLYTFEFLHSYASENIFVLLVIVRMLQFLLQLRKRNEHTKYCLNGIPASIPTTSIATRHGAAAKVLLLFSETYLV